VPLAPPSPLGICSGLLPGSPSFTIVGNGATPSYMGGEATGERVPVRLLGDGFPEAIDPIGEELGIGQ
jgi:hypothetical protein